MSGVSSHGAFDRYAEVLGPEQFALAVRLSRGQQTGGETQRQREALIRALPGRKRVAGGIRRARELVDAAWCAIDSDRRDRRAHHVRGAEWPFRAPEQELRVRVWRRVVAAVCAALRCDVSGDTTYDVRLTDDPALVGVRTETWNNWHVYAKSCQFPAHDLRFTIAVPRGYLRRVAHAGLSVVDGLVTLDAQRLRSPAPGIDLFAAHWAAQGRGTHVNVVSGFIARGFGWSYHADTAERAVAGLRRKAGAAVRATRARTAFIRRWAGSALPVGLADAVEIGACGYGIRSWCNAVGLSDALAARETTAAALIDGYRRMPLPEVRAAILHAARRQV